MRRAVGRVPAALSLAVLAVFAAGPVGGRLRRLQRSWAARVAVEGDSMAPVLRPGDWLLVDPRAYANRAPTVGDLVLVPDPRVPDRLVVKRVAETFQDGGLEIRGDAARSTDSRVFGPVRGSDVTGRPWLRYWPPRRVGRVR